MLENVSADVRLDRLPVVTCWPDDGGPFVTNADKNVTWTILALAMRTSTHIVELRKAGTI